MNLGGINEPIIGQRKIDQDIRLREGRSEPDRRAALPRRTTRPRPAFPGWPISRILGKFFSGNSVDRERDEIMIALIPHMVRRPDITPENMRGVASGRSNQVSVHVAPWRRRRICRFLRTKIRQRPPAAGPGYMPSAAEPGAETPLATRSPPAAPPFGAPPSWLRSWLPRPPLAPPPRLRRRQPGGSCRRRRLRPRRRLPLPCHRAGEAAPGSREDPFRPIADRQEHGRDSFTVRCR